MTDKVLTPYINIFQTRVFLSSTFNRKIFYQKIQDRDTYTAVKTRAFLETDPDLSRADIMLTMGSTIFMLYAAYKGCCDINWEKLFSLCPRDYCDYINAGYETIARRFPEVVKEFNKLDQEQEREAEQNL